MENVNAADTDHPAARRWVNCNGSLLSFRPRRPSSFGEDGRRAGSRLRIRFALPRAPALPSFGRDGRRLERQALPQPQRDEVGAAVQPPSPDSPSRSPVKKRAKVDGDENNDDDVSAVSAAFSGLGIGVPRSTMDPISEEGEGRWGIPLDVVAVGGAWDNLAPAPGGGETARDNGENEEMEVEATLDEATLDEAAVTKTSLREEAEEEAVALLDDGETPSMAPMDGEAKALAALEAALDETGEVPGELEMGEVPGELEMGEVAEVPGELETGNDNPLTRFYRFVHHWVEERERCEELELEISNGLVASCQTPCFRTDFLDPIEGKNIFCNGHLCGNHSFLCGATLHECGECGGEFCSGDCWDSDASTCKFCSGEKVVEVVPPPKLQIVDYWTPALEQRLVDLVGTLSNGAAPAYYGIPWKTIAPLMPARSDGQKFTRVDLQSRWKNGRARALKNRINTDGIVFESAEAMILRQLVPTTELPAMPPPRNPHPKTVLSRPGYRTVYSVQRKVGEWCIDEKYYPPGNRSAAEKEMAKVGLKHQVWHGMFLDLWTMCKPLLELDIQEEDRDKPLSDFSVEEKHGILVSFCRRMKICTRENPLTEITEEEVVATRNVLSTNILDRKEIIEATLAQYDPNIVNASFEQVKENLELAEAKELAETVDSYRLEDPGLGRNRPNFSKLFSDFKDDVMCRIRALSSKLPELNAIQRFEDISVLTEEEFNGNIDRNIYLGKFIRDLVCLVSLAKCGYCLKGMLELCVEEWTSVNLDHGIRGGEDYLVPYTIARNHGAVALCDAVVENRMVPACGRCHRRNEEITYPLGRDCRVCLLPPSPPDRDHRRTPEEVLIGRTTPLESIEEWNGMTERQRGDFLIPIVYEFMWMDMLLSGMMQKSKIGGPTFDTARVIFLSYLGRDADSFFRCDASWWNSGKGTLQDQATSQVMRYVLKSLCNWDPAKQNDEDARLWDLSPQDYFAVHDDHFGGKGCSPSKLDKRNSIFMLNEYASFLVPMMSSTHAIRTANQTCDKRPSQKEWAVPRDFDVRSKKHYSKERLERLS